MFSNFLQWSLSFIVFYYIFQFYQTHLSISDHYYKTYQNAVEFMQRTLAEQINLNQHHFTPCKQQFSQKIIKKIKNSNCGTPLNLQRNINYCKQSDTHKLLHPAIVLEDQYVFREYAGEDLARNLIKSTMFDAIPQYSFHKVKYDKIFYQMPNELSVFYTYAKNLLRTHTLGFASGCIFQKYMHVPGQDEIALKSNQYTHFHNYIDKLKRNGISQECIEDSKYLKKTYRMWIVQECEEIISILKSKNYREKFQEEGIQYILKTNQHLGKGILILDDHNEYNIRRWYGSGTLCGRNESKVIIQEYIKNTYLYQGHKMEFRAYFTIASTNPDMLYGYKVALIKQCAKPFNLKDNTIQVHVCNTAITKKHNEYTQDQQITGESNHYIDWNLEELQELLIQQGRIDSKTWLDDYLLPQIYRKVTYMYLSIKDMLFHDSRVGEMFGVDFLLDNDLRLWILECNRNPNFLAVTQGRINKFNKLIPDMIDLQIRLIRSKYKRIKQFVEDNLQYFKKGQFPDNYTKQKFQKTFLELQQDGMEPEYELPQNSFLQLIYQDQKGQKKSKYVPNQCLVD